jgi:hypothetical protein
MKRSQKKKHRESSLAHPDYLCPTPYDVSCFERKLYLALKKHKTKWYAKHRMATEVRVCRYLAECHITPTVNFQFYRSMGVCVLIGKAFLYTVPARRKLERMVTEKPDIIRNLRREKRRKVRSSIGKEKHKRSNR